MPRRSIAIVTPPADEPVTLEEAKAWVRIDTSDDDAVLTALISASREAVEQYLRRSLLTQTLKLTIDAPGSRFGDRLGEGNYDLPVSVLSGDYPWRYELPKPPIQSVTSFVTTSITNVPATFDPSNYFLDSDGQRLILNETATLPSDIRPSAGIEITYVAGYGDTAGDVPQAIRTAILMTTGVMYDSRGACDNADIPPGAKRLLNAYRIRDGLLDR